MDPLLSDPDQVNRKNGDTPLELTLQRLEQQLEEARAEIRALKEERDALRQQQPTRPSDQEQLVAQYETEVRLDTVLEHLPVGVWFSNAQGDIIYGNPAGQHIWEGARYVGPEQFDQYRAWWYESGIELQPDDWAVVRAVRKGETSLNEELIIQCFDGSRKVIHNSAVPMRDESGRLLGAVVLNEDITERLVAEENRKQSEKRYQTLVESLHEGVWLVDEQARTQYVNPQMAAMLGYTQDEMAGRIFFDFMEPDTAARARQEFENRREGKPGYIERELLKKDGSLLYVIFASTPLFSKEETFTGVLSGVLDISIRKQTEATLEAYAHRLAASNRELEQFAFIASHDLKEPLRKIESFGNILNQRALHRLDEVERDYLERMVKASSRMSDMIKDLLELSRVSTRGDAFQPVDLNTVMHTVLENLELQVEKTSAIVEISSSLPVIEADRLQMQQLFQNLVSNAIKFARKDVRPHVRIYCAQIAPPRRPSKTGVLIPGGGIEVTVEDNGIGFDPEISERLFQPFFRLHGRYEYDGSGIGLAICRKIVERHGGAIKVASTPGEGSKFTIQLRTM